MYIKSKFYLKQSCCHSHMDKLKTSLSKLDCKEDVEKENDPVKMKKIEQRYVSARHLIDGQINMILNFLSYLDK